MNKKIIGFALGAMLLAHSFPVEAQQARVYKIAFLSIASSSALALAGSQRNATRVILGKVSCAWRVG